MVAIPRTQSCRVGDSSVSWCCIPYSVIVVVVVVVVVIVVVVIVVVEIIFLSIYPSLIFQGVQICETASSQCMQLGEIFSR